MVNVLDLGCGAGGAARRLISAGATVTGIDVHNFSHEWSGQNNGPTEFIQGDICHLDQLLNKRVFDVCLCNRTLHYLPYLMAKTVLKRIRRHIKGQLFISFSGLTSDLARGYAASHQPVESRFDFLATADQETFGITASLTLYTEAEAIALVQQSGWKVDWVRTTDFGNILIVAS